MKTFVIAVVCSTMCASHANAYPTRVGIETCKEGSNNDVAVLSWKNMTVDGSKNYNWALKNSSGVITDEIKIRFIDQTISMERTVPQREGSSGNRWTFTSLDPLHFDTSRKYDAMMYTTTDFLWFEIVLLGATVTPIYSTVFFVGAPEALVRKAINGDSAKALGCTNYDNLKADVQTNYASQYDPNDLRMIQYTLDAQGIVGTINTQF